MMEIRSAGAVQAKCPALPAQRLLAHTPIRSHYPRTTSTGSIELPLVHYHSGRRSASVVVSQQAAQTSQTTTVNAETLFAQDVSVAVIGVGLMGNKIARRLASQGARVCAWNRNPEKLSSLPDAGISVCSSLAEATAADVLLLTLSDAATIRATILSDDVRHLLRGKTVLQMGTIGPKESVSLAAEVSAAGGRYVEAPVLGSQPEAEKGTLLIMVGADSDPRDSPEGAAVARSGPRVQPPLHRPRGLRGRREAVPQPADRGADGWLLRLARSGAAQWRPGGALHAHPEGLSAVRTHVRQEAGQDAGQGLRSGQLPDQALVKGRAALRERGGSSRTRHLPAGGFEGSGAERSGSRFRGNRLLRRVRRSSIPG